ncbi:GNAT family N-acetyltransferase [Streptococcus sp. DD13]|uniref:GNAT family N-acetyltransferase n=1 Tax=Streptococcus sp. DD13 TaxID=1777881 RepID=UPI0007936E03|nr:GNAT family protein [Streptococcus sp. DD13]KXT78365.1 Ribosomal-protein-S5p-alanine acetyltransferase [Streptococcus sp. DD13]
MSLLTALARFSNFELENLLLRPFSYEDLDSFYHMVSSEENIPFLFPPLSTKTEAEELFVASFLREPLGTWAIVQKVNHELIGAIRFEKIVEGKMQAELGYFLNKNYWGQGIMTQVVQNLVYLSFYHLELQELVIVTHLENKASQRVAQKAGFRRFRQYKGSDRYTHQVRDYLSFRLARKEYHLEEDLLE